jgi:hypothetical protein
VELITVDFKRMNNGMVNTWKDDRMVWCVVVEVRLCVD